MKIEIQKQVKTDRHTLKLISPICVENRILSPGTFVQASPLEAADLIGRKRAVAATEAEAADNADEIIVAPIRAAAKEWVDA